MYLKVIRSISDFIRHKVKHWYQSKSVLTNIGWLLADKFTRILVGVLVGAWVARYLGVQQYGELAYIIAIVGIFQTVTQLGLDNIAIREISKTPENSGEILGSVFRLRLISGFFGFFGVLAVVNLIEPGDRDSLMLTALVAGGLIFQTADTVDLWFQSTLQSKRTVYAKAISYILINVIRILFIIFEMPLLAFAMAILIEAMISALALAFAYKKYPTIEKWRSNWQRGRILLLEAAPFLFSGIVLSIYMQLDKVLLRNLVDKDELGFYVAASTLSSAFNFLPLVICASLAPRIAKIETDVQRAMFFVKLYSALWWIGVIIALSVGLLSEHLIIYLYGDTYQQSASILRYQLLSIAPIFISVGNDYFTLSKKRGGITLIRTIVGLVVGLLFNFLLIPSMGASGAAIASFSAHIISNTFVYWLTMEESLKIHMKALILPIVGIRSLIKP